MLRVRCDRSSTFPGRSRCNRPASSRPPAAQPDRVLARQCVAASSAGLDLTGTTRNCGASFGDESIRDREAIEGSVVRHAPVVLAGSPTQPEPKRSKVNASVPPDLVKRFEQTAGIAGATVPTALEGALTRWIERNSGGDHGHR